MNRLRKLILTILSLLPITSISFAANKALILDKLRDTDYETERTGVPSIM